MIPYEHTGIQHIRRMVPNLGPEFTPGHVFVVQPAAESESAAAAPSLSHMDLIDHKSDASNAFHAQALTVECTVGQNSSDIGIQIRYDSNVRSADSAKQLLDQLGQAVEQLALSGGDESIAQLQLLTAQDRARLCEWNSIIPPRVERCIHQLVEQRMASQPSALAIKAWDGDMTYAELDGSSRHLALHLAQMGVGPDVMVGVCMDKSKMGVVAMLAILRAGGAVVPLGVQHPLARIQDIVKDTGAPLVLVDQAQQQRLAEGLSAASTQLLVVESFFQTGPRQTPPLNELCVSVRPNHIAWVVYTSGSTGTPKGVVLEHGALATSVLGHGAAYNVRSDDRILQFASYTFHAAIQEIVTTLVHGACICVPTERDRVERLTDFFVETGITMATLTSTVAGLVQPHMTPAVRTIVLVGEAVQAKVVDQWLQQATTVINGYGPSECSIASTCEQIRHSSFALNIGTAIAGATWIVNPADRLVPVGAPGELLLEGPLLARGYPNDPAKTAAAFVTDATFVEELSLASGNRRMYRTGDRQSIFSTTRSYLPWRRV